MSLLHPLAVARALAEHPSRRTGCVPLFERGPRPPAGPPRGELLELRDEAVPRSV